MMQTLRQHGLSLHDFDNIDRIGIFLRFLKAGSYQQQILLMDDEQRNKLKKTIEKYKSIHIELFKSKYDLIVLESPSTDDVFLKMRSFLWSQSIEESGEESKVYVKLGLLYRVEKAYQAVVGKLAGLK